MEGPGHSLHGECVFKPTNTLRQILIHPKDVTPKRNRSNVVYAVQCKEKCLELYTGDTKQPLNRRMAQHRRDKGSGPQSAVFLHLKDKGHSFDDQDLLILDQEDRWFERGVRETIHVYTENPSLNRDGGLRYNLSPIYHAAFSSVTRKIRTKHTRKTTVNHPWQWVEKDCRSGIFTQPPWSFVHLRSLFRPGGREANMEDIWGVSYHLSSDWRSYLDE